MKLSQLFSFGGSTGPVRALGLDIGSSSVKVVELEERAGVLTLTTYGETQLGPYDGKDVGQAVVLDATKEQQAVVDVLRESATKARSAVLAMPLSASFVTVMSLLAAPDEDLSPRIRIEARKYIPTQINEVTLDWAEVASVDESGSREVLLAAIQNDALARMRSLSTFVGFGAPPTEIECFSAIRAAGAMTNDVVALIDIGATVTKLYLTRAGLLQRMHRVRAGGAIVTQRLAESLTISFSEAEMTKRSSASDGQSVRDIDRASRSVYDHAFEEFRHVMADYEHTHGVAVGRVLISGGGALYADVVAEAKQIFDREVEVVNPFSKVAYPAFMDDHLRSIGPSFTVALGAALRAFE